MGVISSSRSWSISCSDPSDHIGFLTDILSRIDKDKSQEAYVLLLATIARAKLIFGDVEGTKADMDAAWKVLDELSGVDSGVNAAYYSIAADYFKVGSSPERCLFTVGQQPFQARADYGSYYKNSLLYLACVDVAKDLSAEDRLSRAHDLSIAAFLGDQIYNFGELVRLAWSICAIS